MEKASVHPLSDVQTSNIGEGTRVWQYTVILPAAMIGKNCNICSHCFIENDISIGDDVTIKSGVSLWDGITIEDQVFVGPNVTFTNDPFPRSKQYPGSFQRTIIDTGASIGAAAVILGGTRIGKYALIAAGSLITKDVPDYAFVKGRPAMVMGWVDEKGQKLNPDGEFWHAADGRKFKVDNNQLIKI